MRRAWRIAGWTALALLAALAYAAYRTVWGKPFTIRMLADRQSLEVLLRNPEVFTEVGIADGTVFDTFSGKLAPFTVKKRDDDYAQLAGFIAEVREFDRSRLDRQDQITYDVLIDQYQTALSYRRFGWLPAEGLLYPISPESGVQAELPEFLQSVHVVKNFKTARNYVRRLEAMGEKLDSATAEMQRQARSGVVLPEALIDRSLIVVQDTIAGRPEDNALVTSFVSRMTAVGSLHAARRRQLEQQAATALRTRVYPAYERMSAALVALKPLAHGQAAGVGRLPDGAAYYAARLREMTTTDYSADKIHELGLAEVARITAEMDALLRTQGLAAGSVGERMSALGKDPRFLFPNDDHGRQQALARYQEILDQVSGRMPEYFRTLPPARLTVERIPPGEEKGTTGAYYLPPALDGSRPGTFYANLRDLRELPTWGMKTDAYHEGIPGHHFQGSIALGLKGLPLIRRQTVYTAYAEGWGLYAERLAAEIGMYRDDPWGNLGRLQAELLRASRLVVDTGLHAQGWSREQAIAYMVGTTGMTEADVVSEVERYMADPGQACAYKVGELKLVELRERARAALGPAFSLKDFHAVVLENGGVPLTVLEQLVDEWIATARGTAAAADNNGKSGVSP